jgi:8-oxo-dGTP pyrophosphatase MutT (NUDIX family)
MLSRRSLCAGPYPSSQRQVTLPPLSQKSTPQTLRMSDASRAADIQALVRNFTAPALAAALRDREDTLTLCSHALRDGNPESMRELLAPYDEDKSVREPDYTHKPFVPTTLNEESSDTLRERLNRLPRNVKKGVFRRAAVVIPLVNVAGVASVLLTKRSQSLRSFKGHHCFPGGMIDHGDASAMRAALRELHEEIGVHRNFVDVLGVLRVDWNELTSMTGVGVTPFCGFLGDFERLKLDVNRDEVESVVTVPLSEVVAADNWELPPFSTPIFRAMGKQEGSDTSIEVWGVTAFLLRNLVERVMGVNVTQQTTAD